MKLYSYDYRLSMDDIAWEVSATDFIISFTSEDDPNSKTQYIFHEVSTYPFRLKRLCTWLDKCDEEDDSFRILRLKGEKRNPHGNPNTDIIILTTKAHGQMVFDCEGLNCSTRGINSHK